NAVEVPDPIWIDVQGKLPSWLNGVLYRIGPGKFILGDQQEGARSITITHAFDGLAYIHRFEFDAAQQKVRYNSRHTAKTLEKEVLENPFGGYATYGTVYAIGAAWHRFMDFLARSNKKGLRYEDMDPSSRSVNVTLTPNFPLPSTWDGTPQQRILVAKTDSNTLQKVHHDTLEPEKLFNYSSYDPRLNGQLSASHHQHDDTTQETFNVTMSIGPNACLKVFKIDDATGAATVLAEIRDNLDASNTPFKPAYIHSFWMTQHYVVVPISPIYFRNQGLDLAVSGNLMGSMEWHQDEPTLFYVVSRDPSVGHIATIPVDSHFAFHTVHGRDFIDPATGHAVLELNTQAFDGCETPFQVHNLVNAFLQKKKKKKKLHTDCYLIYFYRTPPSTVTTFGDLRRYRVVLDKDAPQTSSTASYRVLAKNAEFARVHPSFQFKDYRFVYFNYIVAGVAGQQGERYGIKKIDLLDGQETVWQPDTHNAYVCSEPIFVPRPGATDEDDGAILSLTSVFDNRGPEHDHCYMLVLKAADFSELARIPLGQFTATTFHGSFVDHEF
ncbi:carotenoid oxygenase, partial [Absidia repens]